MEYVRRIKSKSVLSFGDIVHCCERFGVQCVAGMRSRGGPNRRRWIARVVQLLHG